MLRSLDAECNLKKQICPKCGARGRFSPHGSYTRHLIELVGDMPHEIILEIKRVRCRSCKTTHAIIPFDVVPYCAHSTTLSARLFELRYVAGHTVEIICRKLLVSLTTYYRIVRCSSGRLLALASATVGIRALGSLFTNTQKLALAHLALHRLKPFESGRLSPAFFDT